jgi:hypothetical protein
MLNHCKTIVGKWAYTGDDIAIKKGNTINLVGYLNRGISEDEVVDIASRITREYVNSIDAVIDYIDGNIIITEDDLPQY